MPQENQQQPDRIAEHSGMWVTHQLFQEEMKPHSVTGLLHVSVQTSIDGDTVYLLAAFGPFHVDPPLPCEHV